MANQFQGFRSPHYTQVPDELFDELMSTLSGAELKVLLYIIRRTFGFKKGSDAISLRQITSGISTRAGEVLDHGTGLSRSSAQAAIKTLLMKGIILLQRNHSAERGDEATTYGLHLADPVPENRAGEDPKIGIPRARKSDPQETVSQQRDVHLRISKAASSKTQETGEREEDTTSPLQPRTGSLRPISALLSQRFSSPLSSLDTSPIHPPSSAPRPARIQPTDQIAAVIEEISQQFSDSSHFRANCTQAMNLYQACARGESSFVGVLYEARSITHQQRGIRKRTSMPYFWAVVRDLLGFTTSPVGKGSG